jgi:hypothetical protein
MSPCQKVQCEIWTWIITLGIPGKGGGGLALVPRAVNAIVKDGTGFEEISSQSRPVEIDPEIRSNSTRFQNLSRITARWGAKCEGWVRCAISGFWMPCMACFMRLTEGGT